jgi:hypothetical protein
MPGDEIAEFLRRAQQRREEQMRKQAQPQTPPMQPPQPQGPPPPQRLSQAKLEPLDNPYEPIVVADVAPMPFPQSPPPQQPTQRQSFQSTSAPPRQVGQPRPPQQPRRGVKPAQPSRRVAEADRDVEKRLHGKFDHELGQDLGVAKGDASSQVTQATASIVSPVVARVQEMLRSPIDLRASLIVAEILKRPNFD